MEKKNPFKFTLGFDKTKASHIRAVELLNSVKDKADLIAEAIVAHVDGIQESNTWEKRSRKNNNYENAARTYKTNVR